MAYVARPADFHAHSEPYSPAVAAPTRLQQPRPGALRRLFDAIMDGRQRRAQRDIGYYVATHGRRMTDSMEREMNSLILGENWTVRR
ncbi:MAG: hypothetical protein K9G60_01205 [Pseudolabrys sp.]|nr:hypothetical protein [Pseudolabrys sp.]